MAFDPLDEETRTHPVGHEFGQDLSVLSIDEIDERISMLEREINRLKEVKRGKESSKAAASAFFKLGTS
ncbi:DUF1192 domain-containing protein [Microvirga rosea]|uniref:DUF1192 domain-containing protein n=1 Tax=Microvirga rosea TaxID=2715425 RepID=UPI001D0A0F65|nr:DUF1192 domain-containing protein [Microvirga rosea]MCB8822371.1 DUF1192 domain-containing protein [Microvirga rosea]